MKQGSNDRTNGTAGQVTPSGISSKVRIVQAHHISCQNISKPSPTVTFGGLIRSMVCSPGVVRSKPMSLHSPGVAILYLYCDLTEMLWLSKTLIDVIRFNERVQTNQGFWCLLLTSTRGTSKKNRVNMDSNSTSLNCSSPPAIGKGGRFLYFNEVVILIIFCHVRLSKVWLDSRTLWGRYCNCVMFCNTTFVSSF